MTPNQASTIMTLLCCGCAPPSGWLQQYVPSAWDPCSSPTHCCSLDLWPLSAAGAVCASMDEVQWLYRRLNCLMWTEQCVRKAAVTKSHTSCSVRATRILLKTPVRGTAEDLMPCATTTPGSSQALSVGEKNVPKKGSMVCTHRLVTIIVGYSMWWVLLKEYCSQMWTNDLESHLKMTWWKQCSNLERRFWLIFKLMFT